jgi:hypothetical protein
LGGYRWGIERKSDLLSRESHSRADRPTAAKVRSVQPAGVGQDRGGT